MKSENIISFGAIAKNPGSFEKKPGFDLIYAIDFNLSTVVSW